MKTILKMVGLGAAIISAICTAGEKSMQLVEESKKIKEEPKTEEEA